MNFTDKNANIIAQRITKIAYGKVPQNFKFSGGWGVGPGLENTQIKDAFFSGASLTYDCFFLLKMIAFQSSAQVCAVQNNTRLSVAYQLSYVMCHVTCIMCHISHVTCHVWHVACHLSYVTNTNSHSHRLSLCNTPTQCTAVMFVKTPKI